MAASTSRIGSALGRVWSILLLGLLAGCMTVTMVPPYDEQIDSGLTSLYADTSAFVERAVSTAGTPAGSYAANAGFYDAASGRVDALIVRAEANQALDNCPSGKLIDAALARADLPGDVRATAAGLAKTDCQVSLLRLIKGGFGRMRQYHQLRGANGFFPQDRGQFLSGGVGAQLRAAITVEVAKRGK